ncbi:hypothetical protein ACPC54_34030 [Kitasatospora sp. NPDC094028]
MGGKTLRRQTKELGIISSWCVGHPNCNPTTADPAKKLFQIVGDVQMQPVYADDSKGPLSKINGFQADR